jgi:sugar/nucleoside kinase (ribokinase family)
MNSYFLIGPVTKDIIKKEGTSYQSTGGPVYYQSAVISQMGQEVMVMVTLAPKDDYLLDSFSNDVRIFPVYKNQTMEFSNYYPTDDPNQRVQSAILPKNPIEVEDLQIINLKNFDAILLSPLSPYDIPLNTVKYLYKSGKPLYIGVQGYLRHLENDNVVIRPWKKYKEFLPFFKMIFLDEVEAGVIIGENSLSLIDVAKQLSSYGPEEVIITRGDRGSIIYHSETDHTYQIPAEPTHEIVDPTGLGDTYMASYIMKRHEAISPYESGRYASKIASLKLRSRGAVDCKVFNCP